MTNIKKPKPKEYRLAAEAAVLNVTIPGYGPCRPEQWVTFKLLPGFVGRIVRLNYWFVVVHFAITLEQIPERIRYQFFPAAEGGYCVEVTTREITPVGAMPSTPKALKRLSRNAIGEREVKDSYSPKTTYG